MLREEKNMKQKELAELTGITEATLSRYENDKREPKGEIVSRIAKALDVTTDFLLNDDITDQKPPIEKYTPELTEKDKKDLDKVMKNFEEGLEGNIMLDGELLDDQTKELFLQSVRHAYELAKLNNKAKYTPKKYRK